MRKIGGAALALVVGCVGSKEGDAPAYRVELSRDLMGAVFGDELLPPAIPPSERSELRLTVEIDRLKTAGWREAVVELIRYGRDAIDPLIELVGSNEESQAAIKPAVGKEVRTKSLTYTVGQVAYHVLQHIVDHYSDYKGELPPADRKAWEGWWRRNRSGVVFRSD